MLVTSRTLDMVVMVFLASAEASRSDTMMSLASVEAPKSEGAGVLLALSALERSLGSLVILTGTVLVTFEVSADASWGEEAGILLVLSVLEESLDLLAEEVVGELG